MSTFQLASRPTLGRLGRPYTVFCNAFDILQYPKCRIYHYDIISPNPEEKRTASMIMLRLMSSSRHFQSGCAFDTGVKNLFSVAELFDEGFMTFDVPRSRIQYRVTLTKVAFVQPSDFEAILEGRGQGYPISSTPIQVLNIFLQQAAAVKFPVHSKTKYFVDTRTLTVGYLEIWKGFYQSVRPTLGKLFVNIDISSGIMYRRGELIAFSLNALNMRNVRELEGLKENSVPWSRLKGLLKHLQVIQAEPKPGRLRTIKSIIPNAGLFAFKMKDGSEVTVEQYFKSVHNIAVMRGPGIVTMKDEVIPFHLCIIKEGQLYRKKLTGDVTTQLLNINKVKPVDRLRMLKEGMVQLGIDSSPFSIQAGLRLRNTPKEILGRVIESPQIRFGGEVMISPRNGSWNMLQKHLLRPGTIASWHVINFAEELNNPQNVIIDFAKNMMAAMRAVGMDIKTRPGIHFGSPYQVTKELEKIYSAAAKTQLAPTLIIVILPQECRPLRYEVKRYGDIIHGVPTQCVRMDRVPRANNQLLNNLILKINAKIGGCNSVAAGRIFKGFESGKTMVIGADVSHPGPNVKRPSVVGLAYSVDMKCVHYASILEIQEPRQEIIQNLGAAVQQCIKTFNGYRTHFNQAPFWPEQLIFYRDGVSEGEIQRVAEDEVSQINAMLDGMKKFVGIRPKLTFIVVGKRHHIRFFPKDAAPGRDGNAPAGLVIDHEITAPGIFDFYLQSQAGLLGTSRPSHYIVIYDENNLSSDELQDMSFTLCHNYARSTSSVSIPAPCYYADIACGRAEFHFDQGLNFPDDLSSSNEDFSMKVWREGFRNAHRTQIEKMFFM